MSESKHTPGPWYVGAQNDALYIIDKTPRPNNDYPQHDAEVAAIAKVYHSGMPGVEEANARLMAAAPDMREALKDILAGWQYIRQVHGDLYGVGWDRAEQKATAALAKADGEPS